MISYMSSIRALLALVVAAALLAFPALAAAQDAPAPADSGYDYGYDADTDPAALDDFREPLAPYGAWVDDPTYGTVWVPHTVVVGEDFQPYRTAGRWAVTDAGDWVWISDYDWGYIPFHYGRWVWISGNGWAWVPGRVYAPAWVVWRVGDPGYSYVGWAPAPPAYVWFGGVAVGFYSSLVVPWWYIPSAYLFHPYWSTHVFSSHHQVSYAHSRTHYHDDYRGRGGAHGARGGGSPAHRPATGQASASGHTAASGTARTGAAPRVGDYARKGIPSSPSFEQAQVPKSAIPKARVKPNQKALALRKPVNRAAKRSAAGRPRLSSRGPASRGSVSSGRGSGATRGARAAPTQRAARRGSARPAARDRLARPRQRQRNTTIPRAGSRSYGVPSGQRTRTVRGNRSSRPRSTGNSRVRRPTPRYAQPRSRKAPRGYSNNRGRSRPASRSYRAPSRSRSHAAPSRSRGRSHASPSRSRSHAPKSTSRGRSGKKKSSSRSRKSRSSHRSRSHRSHRKR